MKNRSSHSLHHEDPETPFSSFLFSILQRAISSCTFSSPTNLQTSCCTATLSNHIPKFEITSSLHDTYGHRCEQLRSTTPSLSAPLLYQIVFKTCYKDLLVGNRALHFCLDTLYCITSGSLLPALPTWAEYCADNLYCRKGMEGTDIVPSSLQITISSTSSLPHFRASGFFSSPEMNGISSETSVLQYFRTAFST